MYGMKTLLQEEILKINQEIHTRPRIGVCFDWRLISVEEGQQPAWRYAEKIVKAIKDRIEVAGGQLYILTFQDRVKDYGHLIDGYFIPGGRDINPSYYGEENNGSRFHEIESKLRWDHLSDMIENLDHKIPIFAVCMGMQFLNCYFGGTLHQELENSEEHHATIRRVNAINGSHLYKAVGKTITGGICFHHQGIKNLSNLFTVTGYDQIDQTIHAIEYIGGNRIIFSVIWHPEFEIDDEELRSDSKAIFTYFLDLVLASKISQPNYNY